MVSRLFRAGDIVALPWTDCPFRGAHGSLIVHIVSIMYAVLIWGTETSM